MTKLYIFDMDGTLLFKTTACLEIAKILNKEVQLRSIENKFSGGDISTFEFACEIYSLWEIPNQNVLKTAFSNAHKLNRIMDVLSDIRANNHISCLITMSPNYFADLFYDYGFDHIFSSRFTSDSSANINKFNILSPADKVKITKLLCKKYGIEINNVAAFGDSSSDSYLFDLLEETVAINANESLKSISKKSYSGSCLWEAYILTQC